MDASNLLKPGLSDGSLSCIGSTTYKEYRQHFEKDRALSRRFQTVDINEPSIKESIEILMGLKQKYEEFHKVKYSNEALKAAVELSSRYISTRHLPDKAIDVIDEVGAKKKIAKKGSAIPKINAKDIELTVSRMTGVPITTVSHDDKNKVKNLEHYLKKVIFGQDEAIGKLVNAIKMQRSGLSKKEKTVGSYLFAGPTGVGKTEVCKQLALALGNQFLRFDMSEYVEKHAVARLIGAPPGYVGYEEGGQLTEAITRNPYAVLLLDEIEKAHPDLVSILLQVMDSGRLTDSNGRTSDFRNVILIMTSNAGARDVAQNSIGIVRSHREDRSLEAIKKTFPPEFINRLDSIVLFKELSEDVLLLVVEKFLAELKGQLTAKKIELTVSLAAQKWILKKGYDPIYGARPLSRTIDEHIKKPLVDPILFGSLHHGGKVYIDCEQEHLTFKYSE